LKSFAIIGAASFIFFGTYIAHMSLVSMADGETDALLYIFAVIGVTLLLSGLLIMHRMTRRSVEQNQPDNLEDEAW